MLNPIHFGSTAFRSGDKEEMKKVQRTEGKDHRG